LPVTKSRSVSAPAKDRIIDRRINTMFMTVKSTRQSKNWPAVPTDIDPLRNFRDTYCEDLAGPRLVCYFIVPRRKGGFVLFSVGSSMNTEEARSVTKDDGVVGFQKAALVTANQ
jgi:hypothetical protein